MRDSGTYALVFFLKDSLSLQIGKLGLHNFPPGYYVYTGSALGGLSGRLRHHLKSEKRLHWHIDYLLQEATAVEMWYSLGQLRLECIWNGMVRDLPGSTYSVLGFGASDCRCSTHLTHFPTIPPFDLFKQKLRESKLPQAYRLNLPK